MNRTRQLRERNLVGVVVAPFHGELEGGAFGVVPNWPVVLQGDHSSGEEIIVTWTYEQSHRIACQDVLLAYRPRPPVNVYLIAVKIQQEQLLVNAVYQGKQVQVVNQLWLYTDGCTGPPGWIACTLV